MIVKSKILRQPLPKKPCAITTYYNPADYKIKRINYIKFRQGLKKIGLPLMTIELATDKNRLVMRQEDAEYLIQFVTKDVLWQKERLLNIGIRKLPEQYDKIIALDCDILFQNSGWLETTCSLLEDFILVQPFEHVIRLPRGVDDVKPSQCPIGVEARQYFYGFSYGISKFGIDSINQSNMHGASGFAWACRRSMVEKFCFYEGNIVGGGDSLFALAAFQKEILNTRLFSLSHLEHYTRWSRRFGLAVQGSVSACNGYICHLWHGSRKNRNYCGRDKLLKRYNFDPEKDLLDEKGQPWRWSGRNLQLEKAVSNYFYLRKEDRKDDFVGARLVSTIATRLGIILFKSNKFLIR
jgi:hypothetical protein